ncbi:MAG: phosphopantetheine-binding protein [Egibacteraceae bacterium]
MLTQTDIRTAVEKEIRDLLLEDDYELDTLTGQEELVALGLNSLMLARLLIQLDAALGVEPFADQAAVIWDVRSVDDLVAVYERALTTTAKDA